MIQAEKQFPEMMKRVEDLVRNAFPIESRQHIMEVRGLRWENHGPGVQNDITSHKEHKLKAKTLAAKLLGDVFIRVKGGRTIDRVRGFVLVTLPHITNRASYIVNGHEVQTVNQLRLRPGPYTRFTVDNNTETFINAAGGGYKVIFNRETKIFRLRSGSTTVYLYPVLKALGISDGQLMPAWGSEILAANKKYDKPESVSNLYRSMRPWAASVKDPAKMDPAELSSSIEDFFRSKKLDPKISHLTMREKFAEISPRLLLRSSQKTVQLAAGDMEADDTESLAFKSIHSVEDFIDERLRKALPRIRREISMKMDRTPKITALISPSTMSDPIIRWFLTSEFTRYSNQQNPIDMASTAQLTTVMGEGGIKSPYAVTDQVREVHPSQIGFMDPLHSPEGGKIGVTGHLTIGAEKEGNRLFIRVVDAKTGKIVRKTAHDVEDAVVAFHDQFQLGKGRPRPIAKEVKAKDRGQIKLVPAKSVKYIYRDPRTFFSATTNAIPFLPNNHANRVLMGDRHIEQAVPLVNPDKPLVQARFQGDKGYEDFFGKFSNILAPVSGVVTNVSKKRIVILGEDRKTYTVSIHDHYPLNGGVFLTDRSIVKNGDHVKKDQQIAENNFTKDGTLAIGKTLKTAFLPYKGQNFEDGIVVSEAASKKLTSEHMHEIALDLTKNIAVGLDRWLAHFPDEALNVDRSKYSVDGIVKKGAVLRKGEVVIPAVEQIEPHEEYDYARLHKSLYRPWKNVAQLWEGDYDGEVMEVVKTAKFIHILIKTHEILQIGDKLSNRHGAKGIVVNVLPDNEMYRDQKGEIIDVLINPATVPGRVNTGQVFEAAVGKLAKKTGKTYLADNFFSTESTVDKIQSDLKKAGLSDTETITDPVDSRELHNILVGDTHFMKLQHQVRKKLSARGIGGYTTNEQPAKISGESAQNIGSGELYALLASGALHFLKDATTLKSQSNPEYWRALQQGMPTPPPKSPFILDKFIANLAGAGINVKREGTILKVLPITDKEVQSKSSGEIRSPNVVRANDLKPERDGLFDKAVTGGYDGLNWAHIDLESAIPNPLMERPIVSLTNLKPAQFRAIMNGSIFVRKDGTLTTNPKEGKPSGEGLKILLSKVDINQQLRDTIVKIRSAKGATLNKMNQRRRFLQALKATKLRPEDAYIQRKVSVIPPKFRPIYPLPDGSLNVADPNHSYREILMINNQLKDLKRMGVDDKNLANLRLNLYGAVQGLVGVAEPLTRSKDFKGFIATVKGRQNKYGLFQGRVVKRPQDLSGRSTVIPDPKLGLDDVGIPEAMAFAIYKPFVVRRLVGMGIQPKDAAEEIEKRTDQAKRALEDELKERPVYINRAPSLHKFSMLPFKPKIMKGQAISVNPLIVSGFNMDFDGDTAGVHVPVSEEARREAFDNLPSKQLFSSRDDRLVHTPSKEAILGLYLMTKPSGKARTVSSITMMLDQFQKGMVEVNQSFKIEGKTWTPGQALIDAIFPTDMKPGNVVMDKWVMHKLLYNTAKKYPRKIAGIINQTKDLGNHYVTHLGFSIGLNDLVIDRKKRDGIMAQAAKDTKRLGFEKAHTVALDKIHKLVRSHKDNRFVIGSILSGAFGKGDMVSQMVATPVAVTDHKNRVIPVAINKSFAEGHDITSYWSTIPGARKGLADKGLGTQETGALAKRLINTTIEQVISMSDCGTTEGIIMAVDSQDALDRVIAVGRRKGQVMSPLIARTFKARGVKVIKVRSPLKCRAPRGICQKCFGLLENGQLPPIGYHIGVLAGQSISEPLTQLSLRSFHTGGAIGKKAIGFERVKQIFEMPENVPGSAVIAQASGKVTGVKKSAAGGWFVDVGASQHFVPRERGLAVKRGQYVKAGQVLSRTGVIKPQDLLGATNDIHRVRKQMISDLNQEFSSGGVRVKRKLFETVVKPMTDRAEVVDAGDGEKHHIYRGEVHSVNKIEAINAKIRKAGGKPIQYNSTLLSIRVAPYHSGDFVGKLMFERPHETLIKAPAIGAQADISKGHPITQYAFGEYFGKKA